jgi:hypothetical protein
MSKTPNGPGAQAIMLTRGMERDFIPGVVQREPSGRATVAHEDMSEATRSDRRNATTWGGFLTHRLAVDGARRARAPSVPLIWIKVPIVDRGSIHFPKGEL